jgi:hypothetical protein
MKICRISARLSLTLGGNIRYQLKTPYRDGTTHVIFIDISTCDACGSAVKVIASIEDPAVIPTALAALAGQALKQILAHLERKAESKEFYPLPESRAPPQGSLLG